MLLAEDQLLLHMDAFIGSLHGTLTKNYHPLDVCYSCK